MLFFFITLTDFVFFHYFVYSTELQIAGTSTEFVNKVLEKVKCGIPSGGLNEL